MEPSAFPLPPDLNDTNTRLQAYQAAGADVLSALFLTVPAVYLILNGNKDAYVLG